MPPKQAVPAQKAPAPKAEVRPLTNPINVTGGQNLQLLQSITRRFQDVVVTMDGKELPFLREGKEGGVVNPETRSLVYAAVSALNSVGSKGGDGAILWLSENLDHPKVKRLMSPDASIYFTVGSDRTGVAGYRFNGAQIKALVQTYAEAISASIREFGFPRPATRGKKEVAAPIAVDFDF